MNAAVILFPGSNRERDVIRAIETVTGETPSLVWHGEHTLPAGTDLVVLPGGFAYGDYLRCGAIAARAPVMDAVRAHAGRGGLVLGICNGFQILVEAGLLPGVLMRNANLRFICRMQHLTVERNDTPFTSHYANGQIIKVAIAHGEGNYVADAETIARLEGEGRVAFRYSDARGAGTAAPIRTARSMTSPEFTRRGSMFLASCRIPKISLTRWLAGSMGAGCSRAWRALREPQMGPIWARAAVYDRCSFDPSFAVDRHVIL